MTGTEFRAQQNLAEIDEAIAPDFTLLMQLPAPAEPDDS